MTQSELSELFAPFRHYVYVGDNKVVILTSEVPQVIYEFCAHAEREGVNVLYFGEEE